MPPENVRYPPSLRAKKYIKNTLPKCYNQLPKRSKIKEALASKNGYRRFYVNEKGELYRGWWKNDMQDGLGIQSDKVHYIVNEGEYHHGKAWGYGVTCKVEPNKMEDILYGGEFVNGVPELMLKDVDSCYYNWENKALAHVGLYVRNDMQIKHEKEEESKTFSVQEAFKPMDKELEDRLIPRSHLFRFGIYSKLDPAIADAQPCYAFYD
ncbi:uncharacterized protein [Halyomorpha halys]|uniref:uncharacterized protein isoform X1 n=1 Tax=Halyomorpha halys TaxID=286706 RepID=UPI0006D4DF71|nr:uncharacterized protein LOC106679808 isoform X1 [Halyomorpha halys]